MGVMNGRDATSGQYVNYIHEIDVKRNDNEIPK